MDRSVLKKRTETWTRYRWSVGVVGLVAFGLICVYWRLPHRFVAVSPDLGLAIISRIAVGHEAKAVSVEGGGGARVDGETPAELLTVRMTGAVSGTAQVVVAPRRSLFSLATNADVGGAGFAPDRVGEGRAGSGVLAAINGGYFEWTTVKDGEGKHRNRLSAVGIERSNGREEGAFVASATLRGSVVMPRDGGLSLVTAEETPAAMASTADLVQCSPWLIMNGKGCSLPGAPVARRSFVAVGRDHVMLGVVSECALSELPALIVELSRRLGWEVERALNLDGGPSTGLWVRGGANSAASATSADFHSQTAVRNWVVLSQGPE